MRELPILLAALLAATPLFAQDEVPVALDSPEPVIGGQPTAAELDSLRSVGYESILSVRADGELDWDEADVADSLGLAFYGIPMPRPVTRITDEQLERFDAFMQLDTQSYLHCGSGNRVAALWAAWLIEYKNVDPDEALARAEAAGMRAELRPVVLQRTAPDPAIPAPDSVGSATGDQTPDTGRQP